MRDELMNRYEVAVIGGGPAGLNAGLVLARSRRAVLVLDSGAPRNSPADGVHGLLGHDGLPPAQLLERGRTEVRSYGGHVVSGDVTRASLRADGFDLHLADGRSVETSRLLVTTGVVDELPKIGGLQDRWGRDILHCPYCHGWEVRDKAIGVLGSGPNSAHQALLFRQLSENVTYFTHMVPPDDDQTRDLTAREIRIVDGDVTSLAVNDDRLSGVRLSDGTVIGCEVLVVSTRLVARAGFLADLGLKPSEHPSGLGEYILVDQAGQTEVPGVWAAGNVTDPAAQVGSSAAAGAAAAMRINADLVAEEARLFKR